MKNRKNWTFATLWLMEEVDVWWNGGSSHFFLEDRQRWEPIVLAARAESVFPRRSLGDWKVVATYTEEGRVEASTQHCGS
jgi:hypothetical protein